MNFPQTEKQKLLAIYFKQMVEYDVPVYEDVLHRVLQTDERVLREIVESNWYEEIHKLPSYLERAKMSC